MKTLNFQLEVFDPFCESTCQTSLHMHCKHHGSHMDLYGNSDVRELLDIFQSLNLNIH